MRRTGYTLFELVLVLTLLVVVASLSLPLIEPMMAENRVTAARDMVRARWAEMRGRAMEEGRAYRFAVTENTGKFRVAPDDDAYWSGSSSGKDGDDKPLIVEGDLPDDVLFTGSEAAFKGTENAPAPGPEWGLTVAVYLPEGTGRDDAVIFFGKADQRVLGLRLRALTGSVAMVDSANGKMDEEVEP